jgi:hypothetical protein
MSPRHSGIALLRPIGNADGVRRPWNRTLIMWPQIGSPQFLPTDPHNRKVRTGDDAGYGAAREKLPVGGTYQDSGTRFNLQLRPPPCFEPRLVVR